MFKCKMFITLFTLVFILILGNFNFVSAAAILEKQVIEISGIGVTTIPALIEFKEAEPLNDTNNSISQWDMTAGVKDRWHYARMISYRDEKERNSIDLLESMELKEPLLGMISELSKAAVEKAAKSNGVKLLKWYPAQKSTIAKHNAIMFSAQMILTNKLPLPMYCNIYVYSQDKRLNILAFLCPDSDKEYWEPIFKQAAISLT